MELNDSSGCRPPGFSAEENMTTSFPLTYPTARLLLGMLSVGALSLLCLSLLATDVIKAMISLVLDKGGGEFAVVTLFVLLYGMTMLPMDFISVYLIPRLYGRPTALKIGRYLRGSFMHGLLLGSAILTLHGAGQIGGLPLAALSLVLMLLLSVRFQLQTACCIGLHQKKDSPSDWSPDMVAIWVESKDPGFSGGIVGLPGQEQIILPSKWYDAFGVGFLRCLYMRRQKTIQAGWRSRGLALAGAWVLMSFLLSAYLVGFPEGG